MKTSLIRLAVGAALAAALVGGAQAQAPAAAATLKVKASTNAADTGRCTTATLLFAKVSQKEGEPADPQMVELAGYWIDYLKTKDEAFQSAALEGMKTTTEGYTAALDKDPATSIAKLGDDALGCLLFLE
ncbi:MAG: hypothetical protein EON95_12365 [Caulobacteraceae bacterium]|nr:hypothetical protein [Caulobacter sp.]RYF92462.1 MAG: hypothetical protein EON95_12365 [Caulobacteraceae bacterium]